ncbi:DUF1707 domain-containing protein [Kutzneria viridogrisea]|uniref:Uncharacterized protein n=2 Tax=Kutzneria TaxID=43356 RepID=W5WJI5_9PSEU|nr:DUF1707 domain-containing protein [Kutzneria albida]AHI01364.1 hypothetical protein KALB_8006 [Kutzneria albida DSM 43870]MBA8926614.1 hypothetical protein [Kutzneria viridogrisea]
MTEQPDPRELRASDADREKVAKVLHEAMSEGRLTVGELDERLSGLYQARTFGELEVFTRDLPTQGTPAPVPVPSGRSPLIGGQPDSANAVAIMSGVRRRGNWVVPAHLTVFAFWGGVDLDLRAATFQQRECTITATAIMGGVTIIVPPELTVQVQGIGVMGGFDRDAAGVGDPNGPVLRVNGLAFWGGVQIKRKPRKSDRRKLTR